jgi:hypothetical protein
LAKRPSDVRRTSYQVGSVRTALISVRALTDTLSPEGNVVGVVPLGPDFTSPPSCTPSLPRHYQASSLLSVLCLLRRGATPKPVLLLAEGGTGILSPRAPRRSPRFTCSIPPEPSVSNHPAAPHDRFDTLFRLPLLHHPASRRRSYGRLQADVGLPEEDLHLPGWIALASALGRGLLLPPDHDVRTNAPGSCFGRMSGVTRSRTACPRTTNRIEVSAQCPNHRRLSTVCIDQALPSTAKSLLPFVRSLRRYCGLIRLLPSKTAGPTPTTLIQ